VSPRARSRLVRMASAEPIAELSPRAHQNRRLRRSQVGEATKPTRWRRCLLADLRRGSRMRSLSRRVSSRRVASLRVLLIARGASLHEHDGNAGHRALESRKHDRLTVCVCRASYVAHVRLSLVRRAPFMVRNRHDEQWCRLVDQPTPLGMRHGFESAVRAQFPIDVVQVVTKGVRGDLQLASDRGRVAPSGEKREDPPLLLG